MQSLAGRAEAAEAAVGQHARQEAELEAELLRRANVHARPARPAGKACGDADSVAARIAADALKHLAVFPPAPPGFHIVSWRL